jgi:hypothetical protein
MSIIKEVLNRQVFLNILGGIGLYGISRKLIEKVVEIYQENKL